MIEFKPEWAKRMDGGTAYVSRRVAAMVEQACVDVERDKDVGSAIDFALCVVCLNAATKERAIQDIDYIIEQLTIARNNMKADI